MTDLEIAISSVESIISNINEEFGKIDKNAKDYTQKVNSLKTDKYIYLHALYLLKSHNDFKESMKEKKPYEAPKMQVTKAQLEEDIMCVSSEGNGKPGHGWGDRNHNHYGPPGQNKKNGITIWEDF